MKIFIIVYMQNHGYMFIESVWSSREAAQKAVLYHIEQGKGSGKGIALDYAIIERELNTTVIPKEGLLSK